MTEDDVLARATRALRERDATPAPAPTMATRLAVLDASDRERRQRRRNRFLVMPIAATLVLAATWAAASGTLARVFASDVPAESPPATASPASPSPPASDEAPALPTAEPNTATATPATTAPATTATTAATPAPATSASVGAGGRADALYATAHRLHFDARDHEAALRAWDAYLEAAPAGRLAPEARYNRGLCLLHLGRASEARAALAPIASGPVGSYRRDEAARLLDALDGAAP